MMERRPADLLAARTCTGLTTPMPLTLISESGGDATGKAWQDLWRPRMTGGKEGRGQGTCCPTVSAALARWRADRGRLTVLGRLVALVPQSCLSPLFLQG